MTDSMLHFVDLFATAAPRTAECFEPVENLRSPQIIWCLRSWATADINVCCPGCLARVSKRTGGVQSWEM